MFYIKSESADKVGFYEAGTVSVLRMDYVQEPNSIELYKNMTPDEIENKFLHDFSNANSLFDIDEIDFVINDIEFDKVKKGKLELAGIFEMVLIRDSKGAYFAFIPDCSCYITNSAGATMYSIKNFKSIFIKP